MISTAVAGFNECMERLRLGPEWKDAITCLIPSIRTVQSSVPLQPEPCQPEKLEPAMGNALKVTKESAGNSAAIEFIHCWQPFFNSDY